MGVQLNIGNCFLEKKMYEEALKVYFKIEYLKPKNNKVWRPIAWCSFVTGKIDQSIKYFDKIPDNEKKYYDWLNLGHAEWAKKNRNLKLLSLLKKYSLCCSLAERDPTWVNHPSVLPI